MTCKPETEAQRLERIATQLLAGLTANSNPQACRMSAVEVAQIAIFRAKELIKQLDALAIAE